MKYAWRFCDSKTESVRSVANFFRSASQLRKKWWYLLSVFWRIKRWFLICFPILVALVWVGQGLSIIDVIFCYTLNRKCLLQDHIQTNKLNFSEKKWKQMACSLIFITFERAILFREKILGLFKEVQRNFQCLLRLVWSQLWSTEPLYCTFAAMQRWNPHNPYVFFQSDLTPCSPCIWFYPVHSHLPLNGHLPLFPVPCCFSVSLKVLPKFYQISFISMITPQDFVHRLKKWPCSIMHHLLSQGKSCSFLSLKQFLFKIVYLDFQLNVPRWIILTTDNCPSIIIIIFSFMRVVL